MNGVEYLLSLMFNFVDINRLKSVSFRATTPNDPTLTLVRKSK